MMKLLFCLLLLTIVLVVEGRELPGCSVRCNTYVQDPVCAFNGNDYKMFQNNCLMLTANCGAKDEWTQTDLSKCSRIQARTAEKCNFNCSTKRKPICGVLKDNYQLFENECFLREQKCNDHGLWVQHPISHCEAMNNPSKRSIECPKICPMNYSPICATDGRTNRVFSNECALRVANCDTQRWISTRSSACGEEAMFGVDGVGDNDENDFDCPEKCDYTAAYVCGFNGEQYRIFGNKCTFQLTKCRTKQSWILRPISDCDGKDDWYFSNF